MIVAGLTGGIASGKSSVAAVLRDLHVPVIDADQVARDVVRKGTPVLERIVEALGPAILGPDGDLDRAVVRLRIAHDPDAKAKLEAITHPEIRRAIGEQLMALASAGAAAAVVEAALLVETGTYRMYPVLIVVAAPLQTQLSRLMARDGMTETDARALLAKQLPLADKVAVATHVIQNDGDREALEAQVRQVANAVFGNLPVVKPGP